MDLKGRSEPFAVGPSKASLLKLRPEILVGLDHVVENLLGDRHGRDRLVERERLERLLVRTLDARLATSFSELSCCIMRPCWNSWMLSREMTSGPFLPM